MGTMDTAYMQCRRQKVVSGDNINKEIFWNFFELKVENSCRYKHQFVLYMGLCNRTIIILVTNKSNKQVFVGGEGILRTADQIH